MLSPESKDRFTEEFSKDPAFIKVKFKDRDRHTYVYRRLPESADLFDAIQIAENAWTIAEARLVPRARQLRAQGRAKRAIADELGVSLRQVNRWLA